MAHELERLSFLSAAVTLAVISWSCMDGGRPGGATDGELSGLGFCTSAGPGCPCSAPGATIECGTVKEIVGGEAICSMGVSTCNGVTYSPCTGSVIQVRSLTSLAPLGFGAPDKCADPCGPSCNTTADTPGGLDAGTGLTATAEGIALEELGPPPSTCTGLGVAPSTAPATDIVVSQTSAPTTASFTAALVPAGCNPAAPAALWFTDKSDLAQVTDGTVSIPLPIAGPITVGASLGGYQATVPANVVVRVAETGTNAPPAGVTFSSFPAENAGTAADTTLEILYPYSGTMLPLGLPPPLVQWRGNAATGVVLTLRYPATGTPIFEVQHLVTESQTAPVPLRAAQPRYAFPKGVWFAFEQTVHRNRATLGDTGRLLLRRRVGGSALASKSIDVRFAPGQLKGRVYYNSYGTALVKNFSGALNSSGGAFPNGSFGAATLEIPLGTTTPKVAAGFSGSGGCYVCHAVSGNGATLVTANESHRGARWSLPATPPNGGTLYNTSPASALVFGGLVPNGTRILSNAGAINGDTTSRLYDTANGALVSTNLPSGLKAVTPAFSTDSSQVAFMHYGGTLSSPLTTSGNVGSDAKSIVLGSYNGATSFSGMRRLVTPPSGVALYPSFLPAGQNGLVYQVERRTSLNGGIGFTRHDCECSTYSGATGELWWVNTTGTPSPRRLDALDGYTPAGGSALPAQTATGHAVVGGATGPAGNGFYEQVYNYEPSVIPTMIGGYSWVVFMSRRMYGNVATINPYASDPRFDNISIDPTPKKLWVAAISSNPTAGADPSFPAFYLPGQELIAGNSRAAVALEACKAPASTLSAANLCDTDLDCCGAPTTAACVLDPPPLQTPPVKHCLPVSATTCKAIGESCITAANCCNAATGGVCANGVCSTPPGNFEARTFERTFQASCPPSTQPRWTRFEWRSRTPKDSRIDFSTQLLTTAGAVVPASPVDFGAAAGADVLAPSWATSTSVAPLFGKTVGDRLRVVMTFRPSTDKSAGPMLVAWRQSFDCVEVE